MGIFTFWKTIIGSLFKGSSCKMYPFKPQVMYPTTRGSISIEIEKCIYCGICARKCPTNAIVVDKTAKKWTIERTKCVQCGCCVDVCPKKCLGMLNNYSPSVTVKVQETFQGPQAPQGPAANA